jgi:uncharacterized protein Yka (UPF0111/DUF47 family)
MRLIVSKLEGEWRVDVVNGITSIGFTNVSREDALDLAEHLKSVLDCELSVVEA